MPTTMPKIFMTFMGGVGSVCEELRSQKLSQIGRGRLRVRQRIQLTLAHEFLKLLAAILIVAKLVETREPGAKQNMSARGRDGRSMRDRFVQRATASMRDLFRLTVARKFVTRLSNQDDM